MEFNMKTLNKYVLSSILLACLTTNNAFGSQYSSEGDITGMFTGANNVVGVFHSGTWFNPAGCTNGEGDKAI